MRYFDHTKRQLIYIENKTNPEFWDSHWNLNKNIRQEIIGIKDNYVTHLTKQYLKPKDGIILEGGCGKGQNVASLYNNGYNVIGIDYAENSVKIINKYIPELDIKQGDVRNLPFENNFFIGYWSIGVIEHFWEGYNLIANEMARVIKDHGYLFLMFPYMSPLRRLKARLRLYSKWKDSISYVNFYQFALNSKLVIAEFQKLDFYLVKSLPFDGVKGTKDEILIIKPLLQKLYDYSGPNRLINRIRVFLSKFLSPIAGHCIILIFKKIYK